MKFLTLEKSQNFSNFRDRELVYLLPIDLNVFFKNGYAKG